MAYAAAYGTNETMRLSPGLRLAIANWVEGLSPRRREVLKLIADGLTNQAIGERLEIGVETVERHVHDLFRGMPAGRQDNRRVFAALAWFTFRRPRAGRVLRG